MLGAAGWVYVGWQCRERALMMNFLPQFFIIIPTLIYAHYFAQ
jgi:hypothetical protein